ncbi:TatD DNase [Mortierella sp. AM989]|nr:TatD DNase [Mortierella sp. AM989]
MLERELDINLTEPMFRGVYRETRFHADDFQQVMSRPQRAGVNRMIITSTHLKDCQRALGMAKDDDGLYITLGYHPTKCSEFEKHEEGPNTYFNALKIILQSPAAKLKVVAIGECELGPSIDIIAPFTTL